MCVVGVLIMSLGENPFLAGCWYSIKRDHLIK